MSYVLHTHPYTFGNIGIKLLVPSDKQLFAQYRQGEENACPYWGRVWPAAIALSQYIAENPIHIQNKRVLELAGGLGLPSLVAAHFAKTICCSDYMEEAVHIIAENALLNRLHIATEVIDWNHIPDDKIKDVILLSDINYEPAIFDQLFIVIKKILGRKVKIILSTPQRLMAKPFIERLLPFVSEQTEIPVVNKEGKKEWISIYVLE